jgi:hypothetical protein
VTRVRFAALAVALGAAGCQQFDPASLVNKLRVIDIKVEPPEIPSGAQALLTPTFYLPPGLSDAGAPSFAWSICHLAPTAAAGEIVNSNCFRPDAGQAIEALGTGETQTVTMPKLASPLDLGLPDSTGGVFLPVILRLTAGGSTLTSVARVRYPLTPLLMPNHNPKLAGVFQVTGNVDMSGPDGGAGGTPVAIDEATPLAVSAGAQVRLRATVTPDSDEPFPELDGDPRAMHIITVTEEPRFLWYATAGEFSEGTTGEALPDTVLKLDKHPPAPGVPIDVWVVAHDDRGGTDWTHRVLVVR